ncbi:hypothetical protein OBBRIDRAFT_734457 [Obba rivulosa]|uniref:ARM repeat superfamily protein n=1 Tax=Obba rivulosa TaxID=1052685 RepID=A0A8E2DMT5_9APHY|nr:hypothetical protein OBBRIDRAFT_734457 [Obba rivulosa]
MQLRPKFEREASQGTAGSTLHLPFMSSMASLPLASSTSVSTVPTQKSGMRRPQSIQSLAMSSRGAPSVTHITRALTSTMSMNRPRFLPLETQVLSALLVPFLGPHQAERAEAEQEMAVETFEYVIRTWRSPSDEAELDRCLWCCKAASVDSSSRIRILGALSSLLFSRDGSFEASSPVILQTLLQAMFSLLLALSSSPKATREAESLRAYISALRDGQCGTPSMPSVEKEYGARSSKYDSDPQTRDALVSESIVSCFEIAPQSSKRWILRKLLEEYWSLPEPNVSFTLLLSCIHWRKVKTFIKSALVLLSTESSDYHAALADAEAIIRILRVRILPEVVAIRGADSTEIQSNVIRLVLELLYIKECPEQEYLLMHLANWYEDAHGWKSSVEQTLKDLITNAEWPSILRILSTLATTYPEDLRRPLVTFILPLLHDRLILAPPDPPCQSMSNFLEFVSRMYPKLFFKPLFTCAASTKDLTIANQLCILSILAKYIPDFWIRDADMMSVALMSSASAPKGRSDSGPAPKPRIGQLLLFLELIAHLRDLRETRDPAAVKNLVKFATVLEARVNALLDAKEQTTGTSFSQRLLLCVLFREIRLLTRSLRSASWLSLVLSWTLHGQPESPDGDWNSTEDAEQDIETSLNKLRAIYTQAREGFRTPSNRRTTFFAPNMESQPSTGSQSNPPSEYFRDALALLRSFSENESLLTTSFELLVSVSGLLQPSDYGRIAIVAWKRCLDEHASKLTAPACFLIMQCAEKSPTSLLQLIEADLSSETRKTRLKAIQKVATISSWRFQLLSQDIILDRSYRRPFKLARPPILFVPTDIGASYFVLEEDPYEVKDSNGHILPLELRRRLSEIGWAQEDRWVDPKLEWVKTPMSLLPSLQLDKLDTSVDDASSAGDSPSPGASPRASPEPSPTKTREAPLMHRDSSSASTHSRGPKRKPVFVTTMVSLLPRVAEMIKDGDFLVASAAQNLVVDFMRDDPALISRTVFHQLTGDEASVRSAVSTITSFLHARPILPPAMAHHLLNHLAGLLKSSMKSSENNSPLQTYAYTIPAIAKLVMQVSKLSVREIRRSKVDILLIPSGALWFSSTYPVAPMFPRGIEDAKNPFDDSLPSSLVFVTMIRVSQNMLFLNMLKRNPGDIKVIRKNLSRLVLPSRHSSDEQDALPLSNFIPRNSATLASSSPAVDPSLTALSLMIARSHLLLLAQIIRCMSRHLSDREELDILLDGVNRILLSHGDDVGIVGQVMIVYMLASTRFRRLFISGGGYTLFMPALLKTYCESDSNPVIRGAIEYAANRFYSLHQESFVFQSLDIVSQVIAMPNADSTLIARNVFILLSSLKGVAPSPDSPNPAGIHGVNQEPEREALMVTFAEDVPQAFFLSLRKTNSDKGEVATEVPEEYQWKKLGLDNLVRLFLTVIAHNPGIQRAERFLRFLLLLSSHLYNGSGPARSVLRDGIDALGIILLTRGGKAKPLESAQSRAIDPAYETLPEEVSGASQMQPQAAVPADLLAMRLDYLSLVIEFIRAGGQPGLGASQHVLELSKVILKDARSNADKVAKFLADYLRFTLIREPPPSLKHVVSLLADIAPIVSAYCVQVDFSGIFDVLSELATNSIFASQPPFSKVIVGQYCNAGLEACEVAASEDLLFSLPLRGSLINLLVQAVSLAGVDIVAEMEKRAPSHAILAGIMLPFVTSLSTSTEIATDSSWADPRRRETHSRAWMRLLSYSLSLCQKATRYSKSFSSGTDRRKSGDSRVSVDAKPAKSLVMAVQLLKVILVRAEDVISANLPSVWPQLASILRTIFSDADATFALKIRDYSEPASPVHTPSKSSFGPSDQENPFLLPSSISFSKRQHVGHPRIVDYLMWSFFEWICLRRTPLVLQMRGFLQEKIAELHLELSHQAAPSTSIIRSKTRPVSTLFSKPRRSAIGEDGFYSAPSTPRTSTFLHASLSLPIFDEGALQASTPRRTTDDDRQAGYTLARSPLSPSRRTSKDGAPRIVHLGPVKSNSLSAEPSRQRSVSPGGTKKRSALDIARSAVVTSPILVRTTYRRVRLVQTMMGYELLLPFDGSGMEGEYEVSVKAWTRGQAVEAIVQETKDLVEEFLEDAFGIGDDSVVLVDVEVT